MPPKPSVKIPKKPKPKKKSVWQTLLSLSDKLSEKTSSGYMQKNIDKYGKK